MASTGERRPALDGIRGVAILLVVAGHASMLTIGYGGMIGVTVFFVLSGYLITGILARGVGRTGTVDLRRFYVRRARRLGPAVAVVLVMTPLLMWAVGDVRLADYPGQALAVAAYAGSIVRAGGWNDLGVLGHTWSLSVEEIFYVVWPLVLLQLMRRGVRSAVKVTTVLVILAIEWRLLAAALATYDRVYYAPDTNAYALLLGCLLALREAAQPRERVARPWTAAALVALLVAGSFYPDPWTRDPQLVVFGGPLVALVAVALVAVARDLDAGFLTTPWLRWVGAVSYGWYLWHEMLMLLRPASGGFEEGARWVLVFVSLGVAAVSWRFIEQPVLRGGRRRAPAGQVPLPVTVSRYRRTGAAAAGSGRCSVGSAPSPEPTSAR